MYMDRPNHRACPGLSPGPQAAQGQFRACPSPLLHVPRPSRHQAPAWHSFPGLLALSNGELRLHGASDSPFASQPVSDSLELSLAISLILFPTF